MAICSGGIYISYHLSLYSIHLQQKEVIKKHQEFFKERIFEIHVPENFAADKSVDLLFKGDDEIMFHGKMYDIISRRSSGDSIFFKCISDRIEDEVRCIVANEILNNNGRSASQKENLVIKFNPGLYTNFIQDEDVSLLPGNSVGSYLFYIVKKVSPSYLNIPAPPPWQNA